MAELTKQQLKDNVAANFKHVRKSFSMTQVEFGDHLGLPQKTIGAIEEGRTINEYHVYKLSRLINVSMDSIFTRQLNS
jgi:DNA-binding XRE family transcriptional regulator